MAFVIVFIKGWLPTIVVLSTFILMVVLDAAMAIIIRKMTFQAQTSYAKAGHIVEPTICSIRTEKEIVIRTTPHLFILSVIS